MRKSLLLVLLLACTILSFAQSRLIKGRITDERGEAVPYATINIKGTQTGSVADASGNFSINAKTGDVLVVSAVGITPKEITVTDASTFAVSLTRQSVEMSEVVG